MSSPPPPSSWAVGHNLFAKTRYYGLRKTIKIVGTRSHVMDQFLFQLGLHPRPHRQSSSTPPDPLGGILGVLLHRLCGLSTQREMSTLPTPRWGMARFICFTLLLRGGRRKKGKGAGKVGGEVKESRRGEGKAPNSQFCYVTGNMCIGRPSVCLVPLLCALAQKLKGVENQNGRMGVNVFQGRSDWHGSFQLRWRSLLHSWALESSWMAA